MSEYFPKPKSLGVNAKVESHLHNYATKVDLKSWYIKICYEGWFSKLKTRSW